MNTKTIKFDLNKYKLYEKIKAKQGDTKSRFLLFQLLDGSIPFNLKNRSVRAYMIKPDGREIFNDLIVNNYNLGYCTLELTNQVLAAQGIVKIELMVTEGDKKLTSSVFELEVVKSINSEKSIVSTNEFTALLNGLAALSEYDNYKNSVKEMEINKANKAEVEEKFISVEEKIKNNSEQLEHMITLKLLMDIDSTNYRINDFIMVDKITRLQNIYMANFLRNLRNGSPVTIACMGDSMTYGHDVNSEDKRSADTTPCDNGSRHSFTRASITYPESLQKYLNKIYKNNVTVINRGYSGDYVKKGMERWNKKHNANLTIIMYGTNDSRADYVPEEYRGNIDEYLKWYEQAIIREILWGKAVVIFTPPKLQSFGDLDVDTFANGLIQLCKKYNVPYIDTELFTINYNNINSDGVHFNGVGYEIFGMKSASVFVSENLLKPQYVKGGTKLLNRQTVDNFVVNGTYSYSATSGAYTPSELNNTGGSVLNLNPGSSITYSFYCEEDDMFVIPYIYTGADKIKISLDFGLKAPENSIDASIGKGATPLDNNKSSLEFTNSGTLLINKDEVFTNGVECLRIPTKGWHTLTLTNEHSQSTGGTLVINGIEFMNYDVFASYVNINKYYKI